MIYTNKLNPDSSACLCISTCQDHIDTWLNSDFDAETKDSLKNLLKENPSELTDAFHTHLSFGTGGLRGIMGVGTNRMNIYTVRTATQAVANVLKQGTVVIGYDSRHHSKEFAEQAARVFAENGICALLFQHITPTPFVSFALRYMKAQAAIMITASHNPPSYNGYKVFWEDGGQVLPPYDEKILKEMKKIQDPSKIKVSKLNHPLITLLDDSILQSYLKAVNDNGFLLKEQNRVEGNTLKIVYTPLHGTGIVLLPKVLSLAGFTNFHLVEEQKTPDGNFPTVRSPNPEDKEALTLGIKKLIEKQGDILIATDPDADRLGVAVLHQGSSFILNGNQIACLLLEHICQKLKSQNKLSPKCAFIKTIATTELFKVIANAYGCPCVDVPPGFKYIAQKIHEWEKSQEFQYIFGGEDSNGYLFGILTRDKDGISSGALLAEAALDAKLHQETLVDRLHKIYRKYGLYVDQMRTLTFPDTQEGKEEIANIMRLLKTASFNGISASFPEKTNFVTFWLTDGTKMIVRPSGTEPKIKLYCSVQEPIVSTIEEATKKGEAKATHLLNDLEANLTTCSKS